MRSKAIIALNSAAVMLTFLLAAPAVVHALHGPLAEPEVLQLEPQILEVERRVQELPKTRGTTTTIEFSADVLFAFDNAKLAPSAERVLRGVVKRISDDDPAQVQLTGHTDSIGSAAYNQRLSGNRAEAVRAYLARTLTSPAPTLSARGRGEQDPIAPNTHPDGSDNPAGRARNRRVTITLTGGR